MHFYNILVQYDREKWFSFFPQRKEISLKVFVLQRLYKITGESAYDTQLYISTLDYLNCPGTGSSTWRLQCFEWMGISFDSILARQSGSHILVLLIQMIYPLWFLPGLHFYSWSWCTGPRQYASLVKVPVPDFWKNHFSWDLEDKSFLIFQRAAFLTILRIV